MLGAYNFYPDSRFTPNADMEANSYWQACGAQSSIWYTGSQFFTGSRSLAFDVEWGRVSSAYHLSGSSGTAWDSYQQRRVSGGWGGTNAWPVGFLGKDEDPIPLYQDISFGFKLAAPSGTVVTKAYISIQCASGYNPVCYYPRISTLHGDTAYGYGSAYLAGGWYEQTTYHQASFDPGEWYYGEGQTYEYSLAAALQAAINRLHGLTSAQWINITFWGASDGAVADGAASFYQDNGNGPTSDSAVLDLELQVPSTEGIGSNYVLHLSALRRLLPGSHYCLEGWAYLSSGNGPYTARVFRGVGSQITQCPINVLAGQWVNFSQVFSVALDARSAYLRIDYSGATRGRVLLDDVAVKFLPALSDLGAVQIYPEWEMKRYRKQLASEHRMKLGGRYVYRWGSYERFEVPLRHVSAATALTINSWWQTADVLLLKIESGGVWEVNSVACVSKQAPFQRFEKGQNGYMYGTLELETF